MKHYIPQPKYLPKATSPIPTITVAKRLFHFQATGKAMRAAQKNRLSKPKSIDFSGTRSDGTSIAARTAGGISRSQDAKIGRSVFPLKKRVGSNLGR
jgi:hypothetical protein